MVEALDVVLRELRVEGAEAALEPLGGDERVDECAHLGSGGLVAVVVFGGKEGESRGVFTGDDLGVGINAGFQGIEADCGLALDGAWTGGSSRIGAVSLDLL